MSHTFRYIADLGQNAFFRLLATSEDRMLVETTARRQSRIVEVDRTTGSVFTHATRKPIIARKTGSHAGDRWLRASRKSDIWRVAWGDACADHYEFTLPKGEQVVSSACPEYGDVVFVGTRKNPEVGDGRVICLRHGQLLWSHSLEGVIEYPSFNTGKLRLVKAYPYRIVCLDDGSAVACSFMNFLYLLDGRGRQHARLGMAELCDEHFNEYVSGGVYSKESPIGGGMTVTIESISSPIPAVPLVQNIVAISQSRVFAVSSKNAIFWVTPTGRIAHSLQLSVGTFRGYGDVGAIVWPFEASSDGTVIVAHVCCTSVVGIVNGCEQVIHTAPHTRYYSSRWDDKHRVIYVLDCEHHHLEAIGLDGRSLAQTTFAEPIDISACPANTGVLFLTSPNSNPVVELTRVPR